MLYLLTARHLEQNLQGQAPLTVIQKSLKNCVRALYVQNGVYFKYEIWVLLFDVFFRSPKNSEDPAKVPNLSVERSS